MLLSGRRDDLRSHGVWWPPQHADAGGQSSGRNGARMRVCSPPPYGDEATEEEQDDDNEVGEDGDEEGDNGDPGQNW